MSRTPTALPERASTVQPRTCQVVDFPIALVDYEQAMDAMDLLVADRQPGYVCAAPVHALMVGRDDPEMAAALRGSTMTVPDGMPIVWAANMLGAHIQGRVYGPELMRRYSDRCTAQGHRVWLYGGRDEAALAQLMASMRRRHPGIQIVGGYSPPFRRLTADERRELVERVNADRPDVLWAGIGVPKQEKWMAEMRDELEVPVMCGVGAAFDFHAGRVPQAPAWMQERGLEWAYRVSREPRRLLPRYLYYNPRFALTFARQLLRERRERAAA